MTSWLDELTKNTDKSQWVKVSFCFMFMDGEAEKRVKVYRSKSIANREINGSKSPQLTFVAHMSTALSSGLSTKLCKRKQVMKSAEKLQDVINELQGKVPDLHLHSIATRIAFAEGKADSLEHAFAKVEAVRDQLVADINRPEGRWGMHGHSCVSDSYFEALEYAVAQLNVALSGS